MKRFEGDFCKICEISLPAQESANQSLWNFPVVTALMDSSHGSDDSPSSSHDSIDVQLQILPNKLRIGRIAKGGLSGASFALLNLVLFPVEGCVWMGACCELFLLLRGVESKLTSVVCVLCEWCRKSRFLSLTHTNEELTVIIDEEDVNRFDPGVLQLGEKTFRALQVSEGSTGVST